MSGRPKAAVNASPLIFLGKIGRLEVLPAPVATTSTVLEEIYAGDPIDHPEVDLISTLKTEGQIHVLDADPALAPDVGGLHEGEASVLGLALAEEITEVIIDDRVGIRAAKLIGLTPISTPFRLLRACREERLPRGAFERALEQLIEHRYFLSPKLYRALLDAADDG